MSCDTQSPTEVSLSQRVGRVGSSTLFLVFCICQTLTNLLGIGYALVAETDPSVYIGSALFTLGFWLIYFACRSSRPKLSTSGVTYLRVVYIVTAVLVGFALGLCLIALCISTTAPTHLYRSAWQALENSLPEGTMEEVFTQFQSFTQGTSWENFVRTVVTTVLVICVVLLTLFFLLCLLTIRTLKRVKLHMQNQATQKQIPTLLWVVSYITMAANLLTAVGFALSSPLTFDIVLYLVAALGNGLTATVLRKYNREIAPAM